MERVVDPIIVSLLVLASGCDMKGRSALETEPYRSFAEAMKTYPVGTRTQIDLYNDEYEKILQMWPDSENAILEMIHSTHPGLQFAGISLLIHRPVEDTSGPQYAGLSQRLWHLYEKGSCALIRAEALFLYTRFDKPRAQAEARRILEAADVREWWSWREAFPIMKGLPEQERESSFVKILEGKRYEPLRRGRLLPRIDALIYEELSKSDSRKMIPYVIDQFEAEDLEEEIEWQRRGAARWLYLKLGIELRRIPILTNSNARERVVSALRRWYEENEEQILDKGRPLPPFKMPNLDMYKAPPKLPH